MRCQTLVALIVATVCHILGAEPAEAQPVIEGEDIVRASDELRDVLYERHELQQELQSLRSEMGSLESRLAKVEKLVALQKQLDQARAEMETAEEAGQTDVVERWELQANRLEALIEDWREQQDLLDQANHLSFLITWLREDEDIEIAEPIVDRLTEARLAIKELQSLLTQLSDVRVDDLETQRGLSEKRVDELNERIARDDELMELVAELIEIQEEDGDVEKVLDEVRSVLSRLTSHVTKDSSEPLNDAVDPSLLPVSVTAETLAGHRGVDFDREVVPLLARYCVDCHGNDASSGDLNIQKLMGQSPFVLQRRKWVNVIEQAKNRVMPPEDALQPSESERTQLVLSLHNKIYNFDYSEIKDPGFESARRLTHDEYDNTIGDLFGVDVQLAKRFPADLTGRSGFDNSANTLFIQPILMERYLWAADEIVEMLLPKTPATERHQAAYRNIFVKEPTSAGAEAETAQAILERFAARAFRRPLFDEEKADLAKHYRNGRSKGIGHREAIKGVLRTTLISPNFLMKAESSQRSNGDYRISDWELASRLSYFLWATMPDQELFDLATTGELSDPRILSEQVDRMVDDRRSATLGSVFAAQWLGSQHVGVTVRLDPIDNPWCTDSLMEAMRNETAMFFHDLVRENEPIPRLVDADFTYLNSELAKHYRISGVRGAHMRRVNLKDVRRGGILGHGSLLAVTSFPYRTSPVVRGKWILDTVLGTPPPPPPPNVSEFSDEIADNDRLTVKQKLQRHRESPNCFACHSQMDPLGLCLEKYDWFGRYRERYGRRRIDNQGLLPNGTQFRGIEGLKKVLVEQRSDDLVRQVTTKMLSYALGRQLEYYDESAIRKIIANVDKQGQRFRPLVHQIVTSYPFQFKRQSNHQRDDVAGD